MGNQTTYETERQVGDLPAVQAIYAAFRADPGPGKMAPHTHRLLCEALAAAGVELGAYDHKIVEWLAGWEPTTCAVIASLIGRAHEAGRTSGAGVAQPGGGWINGPCR